MPNWLFAIVVRPVAALAFVLVFWALWSIPKLLIRSPTVLRWLYGDLHENLAAWRGERARRRETADRGRLTASVGRDQRL